MGDAAQLDCGVLAGSVMNRFAIKGWCPSAYRPMQSGDGLVVRIRPRGGRLSAVQASSIADLAERHGNGLIDLTGRANLQIRGVRAASHEALLDALMRLGLIDADEDTEARRNVVVAPFWNVGDETQSLAAELEQSLAAISLGLPSKFGFAVDCAAERVLAQAPADIRSKGLRRSMSRCRSQNGSWLPAARATAVGGWPRISQAGPSFRMRSRAMRSLRRPSHCRAPGFMPMVPWSRLLSARCMARRSNSSAVSRRLCA